MRESRDAGPQGKAGGEQKRTSPPVTTVPTDEIYERYLKRAITEINDLGDELARAAGSDGVPVLGSGHPLADIFLLKFSPQPAEINEGVAFFGRAGEAVKKSLQRLGVDLMAVYGTNCLKLAGVTATEAQAHAWLARELHIVGPKLLVVMGDETVDFLNAVAFPLSDPLERREGETQRYTATIAAIVTPDIDASLDDQAAKTRFWNAFKAVGPWWAELPPY
jgi:uracil-DNA glycosylase family 4